MKMLFSACIVILGFVTALILIAVLCGCGHAKSHAQRTLKVYVWTSKNNFVNWGNRVDNKIFQVGCMDMRCFAFIVGDDLHNLPYHRPRWGKNVYKNDSYLQAMLVLYLWVVLLTIMRRRLFEIKIIIKLFVRLKQTSSQYNTKISFITMIRVWHYV